MKRVRIFLSLGFLLAIAMSLSAKKQTKNYTIDLSIGQSIADFPVVCKVPTAWVKSAVVYVNGVEVPSQLDDLNGNGKFDELAFLINWQPNKKMKVKVVFSDAKSKNNYLNNRLHTQMYLKEGKENIPMDVIEGEKDNMYNKLHHHGPAFESELIGYRIYFDKKQTIDIYGKYAKQLELKESLWYPTDDQLRQGFGDDILRVFGSVGVGALKPWNGKQAIHYADPIKKRKASIVAKGPVRTVVQMQTFGFPFADDELNITSRYILYAGHRDLKVENRIEKQSPASTPQFCTGVQRIIKEEFVSDGKGMMAVWGADFPVNDTVKYARQTVGLAISLDQALIKNESQDKVNHLYLLAPSQEDEIEYDYWLTSAAEKESFGYKNASDFFAYVRQWHAMPKELRLQ